jgi:hypothetical protein
MCSRSDCHKRATPRDRLSTWRPSSLDYLLKAQAKKTQADSPCPGILLRSPTQHLSSAAKTLGKTRAIRSSPVRYPPREHGGGLDRRLPLEARPAGPGIAYGRSADPCRLPWAPCSLPTRLAKLPSRNPLGGARRHRSRRNGHLL